MFVVSRSGLIQEQPIKLVAYAYFFVVDFVVNILYTILFASIWFLIVADSDQAPPLGSKPLDNVKSVAGIVDPVVASPNSNILEGSIAGVSGTTGGGTEGSTLSTVSIAFFWLVKLYFILIVFAYARTVVVRTHVSVASIAPHENLWGKAQRWMLSGTYWREDDDDYKPVRVN